MTRTAPPVSVWHSDHGIMIALTRPGDDTSTCVHLPPEAAAELIDSIVAAMAALGTHQRMIADIDAIILNPDDEPNN